jgi:hypothetical protein
MRMMLRFHELFVGAATSGWCLVAFCAIFQLAPIRRELTDNEHLFKEALPTQLAGLYHLGQT